MLSRSHTFHGAPSPRFNLTQSASPCRQELQLVKLPPIKGSDSAAPQQAACTNNELARLKAQQTVSCSSKLCFSKTPMFPTRSESKTAISVHPKFLDTPPSPRLYYPGYSPYLMDRDSQQRFFMSGYSGFVPRLRHRLGATFPVLTHDAMDEFDTARSAHAASLAVNQDASDTERPRVRGRRGEGVIYRRREGLVPNYQGHVPGHQRRFGQSFGNITVNARELP